MPRTSAPNVPLASTTATLGLRLFWLAKIALRESTPSLMGKKTATIVKRDRYLVSRLLPAPIALPAVLKTERGSLRQLLHPRLDANHAQSGATELCEVHLLTHSA